MAVRISLWPVNGVWEHCVIQSSLCIHNDFVGYTSHFQTLLVWWLSRSDCPFTQPSETDFTALEKSSRKCERQYRNSLNLSVLQNRLNLENSWTSRMSLQCFFPLFYLSYTFQTCFVSLQCLAKQFTSSVPTLCLLSVMLSPHSPGSEIITVSVFATSLSTEQKKNVSDEIKCCQKGCIWIEGIGLKSVRTLSHVRKSEAQLNWEQKSFARLVVMPLAMAVGPVRKDKHLPCVGVSQLIFQHPVQFSIQHVQEKISYKHIVIIGPNVSTSSYSYAKGFSHMEHLIFQVQCSSGHHISDFPTVLYLLWLCCAARSGTREKSFALSNVLSLPGPMIASVSEA